MIQDKRKWRSSLFSALGEGFLNDPTLKDGIHLRWNMDPRLGLPYKMYGCTHGGFTIYSLVDDFASIVELDLEKAPTSIYRIREDSGIGNAQGQVEYDNGRYYFSKLSDLTFMNVFWQYYLKIQLLISHFGCLGSEEQRFITYMQLLMKRLLPELAASAPTYVYEDVVAADIVFDATSGLSPTISIPVISSAGPLLSHSGLSIDPSRIFAIDAATVTLALSPSSTLFGAGATVTTSFFSPTIYARIKGFDREGRLIDTDWVGRHPLQPIALPGTTPPSPNSPKMTARLRAPGIAYFTVEPVPGQPAVSRKKTLWLFCEDYCRSDQLWRSDNQDTHKYKADAADNSAQTVRNEYYRPFNKQVDHQTVSGAITAKMITDVDLQEMLKADTTYHAYHAEKKYTDQSLSTNPGQTSLSIPLLPSLMQAAVDPLMARILGLYGYLETPGQEKCDYKIEAELPFFNQKNLDRCENVLKRLSNTPATQAFFQDSANTLTNTILCGLVLNPSLTHKAAPTEPAPLNNEINVIDLPSNTVPGRTDLVVDSNLKIPVNTDELKPFRRSVCYEIERRTKNTTFDNIIQPDMDNLDDIGILPPVYLPKRKESEAGLTEIKDFFFVPALAPELVQYRAKSFDIFGRPSNHSLSQKQEIQIPCHPPKAPINISANLVENGELIEMHLAFSVFTKQGALEAHRKKLEILIHRLPSDISTTPDKVTWSGIQYARQISLNFDNNGIKLLILPGSQSCLKLTWNGSTLNRSSAANSDCFAFFPDIPVKIEENQKSLYDPTTMELQSLKAIFQIGSKSALGADLHNWCTRLRIKGTCPFGSNDIYSAEPCIGSQINITPPPPEVLQPLLPTVPLSTYPDKFGDGYFTLDLSKFLSTAEQSQEPLINIYATTLDRLSNDPDDYVDGQILLNETGFLAIAKQSRLRFERLTSEPITYKAATRYYRIKVPADLEQYHVIGVIGTNPYLEEKPWGNCGVVLVKTPAPLPKAALVLVEGRTTIQEQTIQSKQLFRVKFPAALTNQSQPPQIQVLRRDLSTGERSPLFRGYAVGVSEDPTAESPIYQFEFADEGLLPWHRYVYDVYLLVWNQIRNQYLKQLPPTNCEQIGTAPHGFTPFNGTGDFKASPVAKGGYSIKMEFEAGEFAFSLKKELYGVSGIEYSGHISGGKIYGLTEANHTFTAGECYTLTIKDNNNTQGNYTFRLTGGQNQTWTKKIEVTP